MNMTNTEQTTAEIRYYNPNKASVILVWGVNGWQPVPESMRPAGTMLNEIGIMQTPMVQVGDYSVARIQMPYDAKIEYGFIINKVWRTVTTQNCVIEIWTGDKIPMTPDSIK
ncbi:MAG: hypothetical protein JXA42_26765 [Anaerolineales bacterium]|nr:hypothetical protein [Anaerolineales bacterium]